MLDRHWRKLSTIGGLIVLVGVALWAGYHLNGVGQREQSAASYGRYADYEPECEKLVPPGPMRTDCLIQIAKAEHEKQNSDADLRAQLDNASWTYALMLLSIGGLILSAAGVVLVYLNLQAFKEDIAQARLDAAEERQRVAAEFEVARVEADKQEARFAAQLKAAQDAASATQATADATLKIGERRSRAYVISVDAEYLSPRIQPAEFADACPNGQVVVRVRNAGQTVAKEVVVWVGFSTGPAAIYPWREMRNHDNGHRWKFRFSSLPPNAVEAARAEMRAPDDFYVQATPDPDPRYAVVCVEIRYSDVHERRYRSCFVYWSYRGLLGMETARPLTLQEGWHDAFKEVERDPWLDR